MSFRPVFDYLANIGEKIRFSSSASADSSVSEAPLFEYFANIGEKVVFGGPEAIPSFSAETPAFDLAAQIGEGISAALEKANCGHDVQKQGESTLGANLVSAYSRGIFALEVDQTRNIVSEFVRTVPSQDSLWEELGKVVIEILAKHPPLRTLDLLLQNTTNSFVMVTRTARDQGDDKLLAAKMLQLWHHTSWNPAYKTIDKNCALEFVVFTPKVADFYPTNFQTSAHLKQFAFWLAFYRNPIDTLSTGITPAQNSALDISAALEEALSFKGNTTLLLRDSWRVWNRLNNVLVLSLMIPQIRDELLTLLDTSTLISAMRSLLSTREQSPNSESSIEHKVLTNTLISNFVVWSLYVNHRGLPEALSELQHEIEDKHIELRPIIRILS